MFCLTWFPLKGHLAFHEISYTTVLYVKYKEQNSKAILRKHFQKSFVDFEFKHDKDFGQFSSNSFKVVVFSRFNHKSEFHPWKLMQICTKQTRLVMMFLAI